MIELRWDLLAEFDAVEAVHYYDSRQSGLGQRFATALADTVEDIRRNPELHRLVGQKIRKCRVRGFPYAILYRFDGSRIDILVVTHLHRQPDWWKTRLKSQTPPDERTP
jgi:plasmid stabilization system protein ParE